MDNTAILDKEAQLKRIKDVGLLAVIRGPSPELTVKMVDALVAGGVYGIEITYSTPNATDVVRDSGREIQRSNPSGNGHLDRDRARRASSQGRCELPGQPALREGSCGRDGRNRPAGNDGRLDPHRGACTHTAPAPMW